MGKHAKATAVATTVEPRDLAYWHRMLVEAQEKDAQLIVDRCYAEFDKLLDAKLASRVVRTDAELNAVIASVSDR